jgi:glycosyltransferase involved in cell wall biosynthesis
LKIVHCLDHFLPDHPAGTEVYTWALCKALIKNGFECEVLIPNYGSEKTDSYIYDDIKVNRFAEPTMPDLALITGQKKSEGVGYFEKWISANKPDIVHFHEIAGSNGINVDHLEKAKASGAKIVFTMHLAGNTCRAGTLMLNMKTLCDGEIIITRCAKCSLLHKTGSTTASLLFGSLGFAFFKAGIDPVQWQNKAGTALGFPSQIARLRSKLKRIVNACDRIIPITGWYQNILILNGVPSSKLSLITQAIPVKPPQVSYHTKATVLPLRLIFIGRIDPLKGIDLLLDVIKEFREDEIHLDIYGSAPDYGFMKECLESTANHKNIRWVGILKQENIVPVIEAYDALVLPSMFSEMSPLTIQEAFAAKVPVIGSKVYGIMEQVQDDVNGLLFDFGNKRSLKAVLDKVLSDKGILHRLSKNIIPPRNFEEIALECQAVYNEILQPLKA